MIFSRIPVINVIDVIAFDIHSRPNQGNIGFTKKCQSFIYRVSPFKQRIVSPSFTLIQSFQAEAKNDSYNTVDILQYPQ